MNNRRRRLGEEQGSILVLTAVSIMFLLALMVLVVDASLLMVLRGNLQAGLDAAVLAAVHPSSGNLDPQKVLVSNPVTRREFFAVGDPLPGGVVSKDPQYRQVCQDQKDPQTGQVTQVCHDELAGWWVTYIVGYDIQPIVNAFYLKPDMARQTARRILQANADAWRKSGGLPIEDPLIVDDSFTCEPEGRPDLRSEGMCEPGYPAYVLRYRIEEGRVRAKTLLAGHLFGDGYVGLSLAGTEASIRIGQR